jgi:5-oxopent-3-ene-1,2,5-tricarboxylate decarboxylase/2-hydroxyhepta-2,4-diene-1,7-dioate isomerase
MRHAHILHQGQPAWGRVEGTHGAEQIVLEGGARIEAAEAHFLPPAAPSKIIATHLTFRSRCVEYKMPREPQYPSYFLMPPSALSAHKAPVARPRGCFYLNYEGELVVVIGRRCKGATLENALDYVRGYTIANDWGVHDFRHADRGAMLRVKGQDGFCPIGPYLVDAADVDPAALHLRTYVNGELAQEAMIGQDLMFSVAYQIADLARLMTLEPGDMLLVGTPAHSRPVQLGDSVAVEIDGIGRLENTVVELDHDLEPVGYQPEVTPATLHVALAIPEDEAERRLASGEYEGAARGN